MDIINILAISLVQGVTEFLPISSSGHLVLLPKITNWDDQGIGFDVAAHLGTLLAVIVFLMRDIRRQNRQNFTVAREQFSKVLGRAPYLFGWSTGQNRLNGIGLLLVCLTIGTFPVALMGFFFHDEIANELRRVEVVAYATIAFGLLLGFADRWRGRKALSDISLRDVVFIGLAQCLALVPGVSRAGVTMTAALFLGFSRRAAATCSMLLAIPVIFLSAALELKYFSELANDELFLDLFAVFSFSGLFAYFSLHFLFGFVEKIGMMPFVIYRLVFGTVLIFLFV